MQKRSKKRRKKKGNSLFGLLILEALAVIAVLSLVGFSQSARSSFTGTQQSIETRRVSEGKSARPSFAAPRQLVDTNASVNYPIIGDEKTLPNLATSRYNTQPNSEYAYPESFHGLRSHSR